MSLTVGYREAPVALATPLPQPRWTPSVQTLRLGTLAASLLLVLGGLAAAGRPPGGVTALAAGVVVAMLGSALQLPLARHQVILTCAEAALLVNLVLVPGPWVPAVTAVGTLIGLGLRPASRLGRALAAAVTVLAAGAAAAVVAALPAHGLSSAAGALVLAGLAARLVHDGLLAVLLAAIRSRPVLMVAAEHLPMTALVGSSNLVFGLAILALGRWAPGTLAGLPALLLGLRAAYSARLRANHERATWRRLDAATTRLATLDEAAVRAAAVVGARELLGGRRAELLLPGQETGLSRGRVAQAALRGPSGELGRLRVQLGPGRAYTDREDRVLTAFAASVTAALLNARLHAGLAGHAAELAELAQLKAHEATHDPLTGLANRAGLAEAGSALLAEAAASGQGLALLLLDLDRFKEVNDTLGHHAGDRLLTEVAGRLAAAVRPHDLVARLGGDEFALLLPLPTAYAGNGPGEHDRAGMPAWLQARLPGLLEAVHAPVVVDDVPLAVEGSVGVAVYPADGDTLPELLRRADIAMYQAKGSAGALPVQRYDEDRDAGSQARLALTGELRQALARDQLRLDYQPKVDPASGRWVGVEALVRWVHPRRGLLVPGEFLHVVEQSGLVHAFTRRVLELALADNARWAAAGYPLPVAVNLSARNLLDLDLPRDVAQLLARHGVPARRLTCEITETAMMSELDTVEAVLAGLRRIGVRLSVDDFGTGYSSLALLARIRLDELKVDRSFVTRMHHAADHAAIVRAAVELARHFRLAVVAEGVETAQQSEAVREMGCDSAQGHYYSRPLSAAKVLAALKADGTVRLDHVVTLPRTRVPA